MLQGDPRVACAEDGAVGDGLIQELGIVVGARHVALEQEVGMRIDETRQHRHLGQVDDAGAARLGLDLGHGPHRPDALAVDENPDVGLDLGGPPVDQPARLDQDGWRRGGRRGLRGERRCQGGPSKG